METKGVYNRDCNQLGIAQSLSAAPLSTQQTREELRNVQDRLKARGIEDWEILDIWSDIAQN